jgi:hypothetical protein
MALSKQRQWLALDTFTLGIYHPLLFLLIGLHLVSAQAHVLTLKGIWLPTQRESRI